LIQAGHRGVRTILWDYKSPYYSWGILASAGGYVFKRRGTNYDTKDIGVATPETIEELPSIYAKSARSRFQSRNTMWRARACDRLTWR
jgi:maltose-binding protein MalE